MNLHSAQLQSQIKMRTVSRVLNQQFWDFDSLIVGSNPAGPAINKTTEAFRCFFFYIFKQKVPCH
jgi:hypothetical protein